MNGILKRRKKRLNYIEIFSLFRILCVHCSRDRRFQEPSSLKVCSRNLADRRKISRGSSRIPLRTEKSTVLININCEELDTLGRQDLK